MQNVNINVNVHVHSLDILMQWRIVESGAPM